MANRSALLRRILALACLLFLISAGKSDLSGQAPGEAAPGGQAPGAEVPNVVYVADFELEKAQVETEQGLLPRPMGREGLLGRLRSGRPEDPQKIVDLMSSQLVQDLTEAGMVARRLISAEPLPKDGWLVRGVFVSVDEGNRLRRAVVGFGAGHTDLQVLVSVSNLRQGAPQPMYEIKSEEKSGKMPGAAITLNPYVAAAKFVLARRHLDKGVRRAASDIAASVVRDISAR